MLLRKKGVPLPAAVADSLIGREVCVYKNLTTGLWSITAVKGYDNRGKLICYADTLVLRDCRATVSASGKERIRRKWVQDGVRAREVVAWFVGTIDLDAVFDEADCAARVTFWPYDRARPNFFRVDTDEDVFKADALAFGPDGNAWLTAA